MARAPDNTPIGDGWLDRLPIDIDTLAALVEGDLDSREADEVRERLLTADPELAHRVEMMCQDRVAVRTLGDERPPAGLAEAVIARLEREALVGLADSGAARHDPDLACAHPPARARGRGEAMADQPGGCGAGDGRGVGPGGGRGDPAAPVAGPECADAGPAGPGRGSRAVRRATGASRPR